MKLVEKGESAKDSGYKYTIENETMYKYHVDDHSSFQEKCNHLPFGGNLSVRKPIHQRPVMILGQDKCIFCQYLFSKGMWVCPDGCKQLFPKDDGQGIMLSLFCCRDLGYGYNPPTNIMNEINESRKGKNYSDEDAAITVNGSKKKDKLTCTPFVRYLEYGANNDGYWKYKNMILQLEDCVDVLQYMFPQFEFIFLFDHSNGHNRMQPNSLSLSRIQIRAGGKQPIMRSSKISADLLGPFHTTESLLQPGMNQSMVFSESDAGPCYLSNTQRVDQCHDRVTNQIVERELRISELISCLKASGKADNPVGNKEKLQKLAQKHG